MAANTRPPSYSPTPDRARSAATQPYRTTRAAQLTARRLTVDTADGRLTLRPLQDVLSPRTRALLAALAGRNGGHSNAR